jgi:hypothetical protein
MTSLIIRCPIKPIHVEADKWDYEDLQFSWRLSDSDEIIISNDLDVCPVVDEVLAMIPGVDTRLVDLKIPAVNRKKIDQILPVLLEDELLSSPVNTDIKLLPLFISQDSNQRIVSIIDREWLLWLSKKLSILICEKIQLIPECLLLPNDEESVYFYTEHQSNYYTYKKDFNHILSWSQPQDQALIEVDGFSKNIQPKPLHWETILHGMNTEKKVYEYVNLLPKEFYGLRKNNHSEIQHWLSPELWKQPLAWARYLSILLISCYLGYFSYLFWADSRWQSALQKTATLVLPDDAGKKPRAQLLIESSCKAAHEHHEICGSDFERLVVQLSEILKNTPPETLRSLEFSQKGLIFELDPSYNFKNQISLNKNNGLIKVIDSSHYLLSPYANLNHP